MSKDLKGDLSAIEITNTLTGDLYSDVDDYDNIDELDKQMATLPKMLAWWSQQSVGCNAHVEKLEFLLEQIKAKKRLEVFRNPSKFGVNKATVEVVNSILALDEEVAKETIRLLKWKKRAASLTEAVWSLKTKKDLLVGASYLARAKMDVSVHRSKS